MTEQAANEAVRGLVEIMVTHRELEGVDWVSMSVVGCTRPGQNRVHRMYGYVYLADKIDAAPLDMRATRPLYMDLISATIPEGEDGWQKCLLQFDRTGRTNLFFEYHDESRWVIDPADMNELPNSLRPSFDGPPPSTPS